MKKPTYMELKNKIEILEEELEKSRKEKFLSCWQVLDMLQEGLWVSDRNDVLIYANDSASKIAGVPRDRIVGVPLTGFPQETIGDFIKFYQKARSIMKPIWYSSRVITLDGRESWQNGYLVPIVKNNTFNGMITTIRDITKDKATALQLKESEERYKGLFNTIPSGIAVYKTEDNGQHFIISDFNPSAEKIEGVKRDDIIGRDVEEVFSGARNYGIIDIFSKVWETGKIEYFPESPYRDKNETVSWRDNWIYRLSNGEIVAIYNEITNRVNTRKALEESERRFRRYVTVSPIPIFVADENGVYTFVNQAACNLVGYTFDELVGMSIRNLIPEVEERMMKIKDDGNLDNVKSFMKKKDGSHVPVTVDAVRVSPNHNLAFCKDISETLTFQQELQKAKLKAEESDRLKSQFLANMSHEIRTPMNGILGFAEVLMNQSISEEERIQYAEIIYNSGNQMLTLVNDILDISKIESGSFNIHKTEFSAESLLRELFELFHKQAENRHLRLVLEKPESDNTLFSDRIRLEQIFSNLINNALKFTRKGEICFGYKKQKDFFVFFVKDTGIGIPEDQLDIIFERFHQLDRENENSGTGLGLAIVKKITELLDGRIEVSSETGKGSCFKITLPARLDNN